MLPLLIIRGVTTRGGHGGGRRGRDTLPLAAAFHKTHNLAQPLERKQRCGVPWRGYRWRARVIGRTHGERRVGPIRELDNQVRINTVPDPNQRDTLAAQRVMGMGDGHRFRK